MPRQPSARLALLLFALLLTACAAYRAQHAPPAAAAPSAGVPDGALPAFQPSGEFSALSDSAQISRIQGEVELAKDNLARQGKYSCCVRPACTECLLKHGQCHCRDAVRKEGPCCGECTEAWIEGRGAVEGVTAWEILERKKKILDEANQKH